MAPSLSTHPRPCSASRAGSAPHATSTVLTNGPDTFTALHEHAGVKALLTGGELDRQTGSLVGPLAERGSGELLLRRLFLSAAALDPVIGTSEATIAESSVKLALAAVAGSVVVAIDSSKLGCRAVARGLPPDRIDILVTELDPKDYRLDPYRDHVSSIL